MINSESQGCQQLLTLVSYRQKGEAKAQTAQDSLRFALSTTLFVSCTRIGMTTGGFFFRSKEARVFYIQKV